MILTDSFTNSMFGRLQGEGESCGTNCTGTSSMAGILVNVHNVLSGILILQATITNLLQTSQAMQVIV